MAQTKDILQRRTPKETAEQWQTLADMLFPPEEEDDVKAFRNFTTAYDESGKTMYMAQGPKGKQMVRVPVDPDIPYYSHKGPTKGYDQAEDSQTATDIVQHYINSAWEDKVMSPAELHSLDRANPILRSMGQIMPSVEGVPAGEGWADELTEYESKSKSSDFMSTQMRDLKKTLEGTLYGRDRIETYATHVPRVKAYMKTVEDHMGGGVWSDWFIVNDDNQLEVNKTLGGKSEENLKQLLAMHPLHLLQESLDFLTKRGINIRVILAADAIDSQLQDMIDTIKLDGTK